MKIFRNLVFAIAAVSALASCSNNDGGVEARQFTVNGTFQEQNTWNVTTPSPARVVTRDGETNSFAFYIFDSQDKFIDRKGGNMSDAHIFSTDLVKQSGAYTVYAATNILLTEAADRVDKSESSVFTLSSLKDVSFGSATLTVTPSQANYSVTVPVNHIMSKLALTIQNVPADVNITSVSLPHQANTFDFDVTFTGDVAQTLTCVKAAEANVDGTYNWTVSETLVYPSASAAENMAITIVSDFNNTTFNSLSTTRCVSGTRVALTTTWSSLLHIVSGGIQQNDWTSDVVEGSFDM